MNNTLIDDLNKYKTGIFLKIRKAGKISVPIMNLIASGLIISYGDKIIPFVVFCYLSSILIDSYFTITWSKKIYKKHNVWLGIKLTPTTYMVGRFTGEGVLDLYKARQSLKVKEKPDIDVIAKPTKILIEHDFKFLPEYCFPIFEYYDAYGIHHYGVKNTPMDVDQFNYYAKRPIYVYAYKDKDDYAICDIPDAYLNAPLKQYDSLQDFISSGDKIAKPQGRKTIIM